MHRLIEIRVSEFALRAFNTEAEVCVINTFLLLFGMLELAVRTFFAEPTVVPRAFWGVIGGTRVFEGTISFVAFSLQRTSFCITRVICLYVRQTNMQHAGQQ